MILSGSRESNAGLIDFSIDLDRVGPREVSRGLT